MRQKSPFQQKRDIQAYVDDERLTERNEEFDLMIELLQKAKQTAFSLSVSPVNLLSRTASDLLLRIANAYEDGVPKTERLNPTIKFDYRFSDPLGNPFQRTVNENRSEAWNPQFSRFSRELAVFFSRSLLKDFSFQKDFHDLLNNLQDILPPGFLSQKSNNAEKINKRLRLLAKLKLETLINAGGVIENDTTLSFQLLFENELYNIIFTRNEG